MDEDEPLGKFDTKQLAEKLRDYLTEEEQQEKKDQ